MYSPLPIGWPKIEAANEEQGAPIVELWNEEKSPEEAGKRFVS